MNVDIRRIHAGEGPELRVLRLRALADDPSSFSSSYGREELFAETRWMEMATESASGDGRAMFIAIVDSSWRGLIGVGRIEPASAAEERLIAQTPGGHGVELHSMWTDPEYRGHGLGRRLVDAATSWAADAGAPYLALWVTRENDRAIGLYQRAGFTETDEVRPAPDDPCAGQVRMVRATAAS